MNQLQKKAQLEAYILKTLEEMRQLVYTDRTSKILSEVRNRDIVIFLGNTRCGKSTIVNHIIGNKLTAQRVRKNTFHIVLSNPSASGPAIGVEAVSETTIPTSWTSNKIDGLVVDAPGFDDNRGEAQDVANAFYIKELITNANSVKFVLICDVNDILNHNIGQFVTFIDKIHTMLPQACILPGVSIVFTKDYQDNTKDDIVHLFREKIIAQPNMKVNNRPLIEHLERNKNKIVITNMPRAEGDINEGEVFQDIIDVIQNHAQPLSRNSLSTVVPGISDRSKCFLLEAHTQFTEFEDFGMMLVKVQKEFNNKVKSLESGSDNEVKTKLANLEEEINALKAISNLEEVLKKMYQMLPNVSELNEDSEFHMKLKFMAFVDSVLEIQESSIFLVKINATITDILESISRSRVKLQEKMMEVTQEEANKKIQQLKDDNRKAQEDMQKKIDNLIKINENAKNNMRNKVGVFGMIGEMIDKLVEVVVSLKK